MKHFEVVALAALAICIASCQKDNTPVPTTNDIKVTEKLADNTAVATYEAEDGTYALSLVFEKTEEGKDTYCVEVTYGPDNQKTKVTDSFKAKNGDFSISLAWDAELNDGNGREWVESTNTVPIGTRIQVTVHVSTGDYILLQSSGE